MIVHTRRVQLQMPYGRPQVSTRKAVFLTTQALFNNFESKILRCTVVRRAAECRRGAHRERDIRARVRPDERAELYH